MPSVLFRGCAVNVLLVRVGADLSPGGGSWNGPVDGESGDFAYVAIPETSPVHIGMEKPYDTLTSVLARFRVQLPAYLRRQHMHLDPDFAHLTYGDRGERAKQLLTNLQANDTIVFYAGLADVHGATELVYAIIGLFVVQDFVLATDIPAHERDTNAHSRRVLAPGAQDLVVRGCPQVSGATQAMPTDRRIPRPRLPREAKLARRMGWVVGQGWLSAAQCQAATVPRPAAVSPLDGEAAASPGSSK